MTQPVVALGAGVIGLALLARSADELVVGSSQLAVRLGVPATVVGVVVIGFGTSAPELLVSALAAASGSPAIGVGTVIGSNIANLTLVVGVAALVAPLAVRASVIRREVPLSLAASLVFAAALQGGLSRAEGVLLLLALAATLAVLVRWSRRTVPDRTAAELEAEVGDLVGAGTGPVGTVRAVAVRTLVGLGGTLLGAQLLVWGAVGLARAASLPEGFIGLTVVAVGTSLPELVTAAQAARRGKGDLIVGNLLGSNLFNALAVGGTIALIRPGAAAGPALTVTGVAVMLGTGLVAGLFMWRRFRLVRWEGALLLALYVAGVPLMTG